MPGIHLTLGAVRGVRFGRLLYALVLSAILLGSLGFVGRGADAAGFDRVGRFTVPSAATCTYGASHIFDVRVPAPKIFARDATSQNDRQRVGYKVDLVRINPDGSITGVMSGPSQFAIASETQAAALASHTFMGVRNLGPGIYAVAVGLYWYQATNPSIVEGTHAQRLDAYHLAQVRSDASLLRVLTVEDWCPSLRPW